MPYYLNSFFITLWMLALGTFVNAQNSGQVEITAIDENGKGIEFVNFRLFSTSDSSVIAGAYSDVDGLVTINNVPNGNFYGVLSFFGFEDTYVNDIVVQSAKVNLGAVRLNPLQDLLLEEVVVRGKERTYMESSIDKRTYNVEEDMTSQGGDLTDVLNNIPSIEVDNDGNVSLRGDGSVTILIDGRESVLSSGEGALNGIPASAIERIEVVTNPSARYNPEGTSGIINIVLKKQKLRGFNANVQLTAASENLYNGSVNLNFRREKINIFGNYSFRYHEGTSVNTRDRNSSYNDTLEFLSQHRMSLNTRKTHTANAGFDFFLKENQTLGLSLSGSYTERDRGGQQLNELMYNGVLNRYWIREIYDPTSRKSMDINANYNLNFKDGNGSLLISASESIGNSQSIGEFEEYYYEADGTIIPDIYNLQNQKNNRFNSRFTFNTDVERNLNDKMKYETGIEAKINRRDQKDYLEFYDPIADEIIPNENGLNQLIYDEKIFSLYGVFGHELTERFKYQAGLRLEQAFIDPNFVSSNESLSYQYFNPFPSLHLSYGDDTLGTFFASYSRRINRPNVRNLNPFPDYDDPLNLRIGNPALHPEYINSYELGYDKMWDKGSITGSIYFKEIVGKIQGIQYYREDGVSVRTFDNVDNSYDYGVELISMYNPFSWWRNMISLNVYESRVSANVDGIQLNNKGVSWDLKVNTSFALFNNTTNIQVTGQYRAPRYTVQGTSQYTPGFDIGITRSLLNRNLVIGMRLTDIFNHRGFTTVSNVNGIEQVNKWRWSSQRLYFTLSYRFGNMSVRDNEGPSEPPFPIDGGEMRD